jgi:small subunit ribosomal protein S20
MPSTKSAKKRLRQNIAHRLRNRSIKQAIRTQCRKVREAVAAGNVELAEGEFRLTAKKLDRAGARNIIHRNAAARTKSRLSAKIKALKAGQAQLAAPPGSAP